MRRIARAIPLHPGFKSESRVAAEARNPANEMRFPVSREDGGNAPASSAEAATGNALRVVRGQRIADGPFSHGFNNAYNADTIGTGTPCLAALRTAAPCKASTSILFPCSRSINSDDLVVGGMLVMYSSRVSKRFAEIVTPSALAIAAISRDAA